MRERLFITHQSTWINKFCREIIKSRLNYDNANAMASNSGAGGDPVVDSGIHCDQRKPLAVEPAQSHGSIRPAPSLAVHHCAWGMVENCWKNYLAKINDCFCRCILQGLCFGKLWTSTIAKKQLPICKRLLSILLYLYLTWSFIAFL